jgi:hypothetical protein
VTGPRHWLEEDDVVIHYGGMVVDNEMLLTVPGVMGLCPADALRVLASRCFRAELTGSGPEIVAQDPVVRCARLEAVCDFEQAVARRGLQVPERLDEDERRRLPVTVWIDPEGRIRQVDVREPDTDTPAERAAPDEPGERWTGRRHRIELFDFGIRVSLAAPRADEITDADPRRRAAS